MANSYSVVEFTEENSIEAVPSNWVKKSECWYPVGPNVRKLIASSSVPDPNSNRWIKYKSAVLATFSKFQFYTILLYST